MKASSSITGSSATHAPSRPRRWRILGRLLVVAGAATAVLALVVITMLRGLKPQPGEWRVHVGPWQHALSVPVLLRWGTHPLVLPLLDGVTLRTRAGRWQIDVLDGGAVRAVCAPCTLRLPALGPVPLTLDRVQLDARRAEPEAWQGTLALGAAGRAGSLAWHAKLQRDGLALKVRLDPTPIAALLAPLGTDAVPELARARIDGTLAFEARALLREQGLTQVRLKPRLADVRVDGLDTDALIAAAPPSRCLPARTRIDGWLPRAVIAAEDQRFYEHAGFDVDEALAAWTANQQRHDAPADGDPATAAGAKAVRGASTLTQQLAKLVYTGDERSATRKVREWLYAVEMERTLGKARILQLYLALAPWGDGTCGAEAAAKRHLGKRARDLAPHEAAWLASLLRRPDGQLTRLRATGTVDRDATARVIEHLRPMPKAERAALIDALDTWQPRAATARVHPSSPSEHP